MILLFLRFHLMRLYRAQPVIGPMLLLSVVALLVSAGMYAERRQEAQTATVDLQRLQAALLAVKAGVPVSDGKVAEVGRMDLPAFDNAMLVQTLNSLAAEVQLPMDEVSYALDDGGNEPYLRYRITLRVASGYRTIKKFNDQFSAEMTNVSLDAISCSRQDIGTVPLSCDLSYSAFYRRSARG